MNADACASGSSQGCCPGKPPGCQNVAQDDIHGRELNRARGLAFTLLVDELSLLCSFSLRRAGPNSPQTRAYTEQGKQKGRAFCGARKATSRDWKLGSSTLGEGRENRKADGME